MAACARVLPKDPEMTRLPLAMVWLAALGAGLRAEPSAVAEVIAAARDADIVVIGEVHDTPEHHRVQAEIVTALQPGALVFEMIPQASEDAVNRLRAETASPDQIAAALDWEASGWPDFGFYAAILEAAPDARIFGSGQPVDEVRRAAVEGAAAVMGPDAASYGLDVPLPEAEQATREADMLAAHCDAVPIEKLAGLVEAQRFRDATIADAARWARTMAGEGPVVVIAGTGHANRLRGVPAKLAAADPSLRVLAVGQFEVLPGAGEAAAFDAYLLAPPPPRADPWSGFGLSPD
jgi:uncharacterized iron-regulated protein